MGRDGTAMCTRSIGITASGSSSPCSGWAAMRAMQCCQGTPSSCAATPPNASIPRTPAPWRSGIAGPARPSRSRRLAGRSLIPSAQATPSSLRLSAPDFSSASVAWRCWQAAPQLAPSRLSLWRPTSAGNLTAVGWRRAVRAWTFSSLWGTRCTLWMTLSSAFSHKGTANSRPDCKAGSNMMLASSRTARSTGQMVTSGSQRKGLSTDGGRAKRTLVRRFLKSWETL
mmetsp:Transcript_34995/g.96768  ORF Transcript_34995/g.96768 Transcript_34995/m.96768 type:complete len:227 (-) Transcript_34995:1644-2324(-)